MKIHYSGNLNYPKRLIINANSYHLRATAGGQKKPKGKLRNSALESKTNSQLLNKLVKH
jgi:hypothetical protein